MIKNMNENKIIMKNSEHDELKNEYMTRWENRSAMKHVIHHMIINSIRSRLFYIVYATTLYTARSILYYITQNICMICGT